MSLSGNHRNTVVYLLTHPLRGPGSFGTEAAAAAFDIYPNDQDLVILWSRWVREGLFDGPNNSDCDDPSKFAYWSGRGLQSAGSEGWNRVYDEFVRYVGQLARKKSRDSVQTATGHMMANVDGENPRADRDRFAGDSMGIAVAIPSFVMAQNQRRNRIWERHARDDFGADLRMDPDFLEFFRRQRTGLREDVFRDGQFPDVMQKRGGLDTSR